MNRLLSIGGIVLTVIIAAVWCRDVLVQPVSTNLAYIRTIPFVLGYIWIIAKFMRAAKDPENYAVGPSQTMFLFMVFLSIDSSIETYMYSMISLITLAYIIAIGLLERFEDKIRAHWETKRSG